MQLPKFFLVLVSVFLFVSCTVTKKVSLSIQSLHPVDRNIRIFREGGRTAVELDAQDRSGLATLKNLDFETGTIEIELLGENNPGRSFIGIAFNIQDDESYEVVYFRPFNFVATEQIRKEHMVQYIKHPEFTWRKLRTEREGEFESEIQDPPDPDDWFTAIVKISNDHVQVFMNNTSEPCLDVLRLSENKSKKIGLWVGTGSSGRFDNLKITRN